VTKRCAPSLQSRACGCTCSMDEDNDTQVLTCVCCRTFHDSGGYRRHMNACKTVKETTARELAVLARRRQLAVPQQLVALTPMLVYVELCVS
jgi:hypothetical protein